MKCFKCHQECYNDCGSSYCTHCKEKVFEYNGISGLGHNPYCGNVCDYCFRDHDATETCKDCVENFCKECYTLCIDQCIRCFRCYRLSFRRDSDL